MPYGPWHKKESSRWYLSRQHHAASHDDTETTGTILPKAETKERGHVRAALGEGGNKKGSRANEILEVDGQKTRARKTDWEVTMVRAGTMSRVCATREREHVCEVREFQAWGGEKKRRQLERRPNGWSKKKSRKKQSLDRKRKRSGAVSDMGNKSQPRMSQNYTLYRPDQAMI